MDKDIEKRLQASIERLRLIATDEMDYDKMDPIARMMLVALLQEAQSIYDYIDQIPQRIVERFCSQFIPYEKICAVPAITLLAPTFREKTKPALVTVTSGATFTFKAEGTKMPLNYIPVFETLLVPHYDIYNVTSRRISTKENTVFIEDAATPGQMWVGIQTEVEIECLKGLSLLISGTQGVTPQRITVGLTNHELDFATMREMENIDMLEPFDAQQASGQFFAFINTWKDCLLNMDDSALLYITDKNVDRDIFKPRPYPKVFQQWFEEDKLELFSPNTLWLQLEFPKGYVVPDDCRAQVNILPVTNVDVCNLTLTTSEPIKKLQTKEGAFFLRLLETSNASQKQGIPDTSTEIIIRDFDVHRYHNGDLYRDVRTLYNRFIDDYYAFTEYNGIKDGEVLRRLREIINRLGKSVGENNEKFCFDSGTYAMKDISQQDISTNVRVNFITTMGLVGNQPQQGGTMDNKKLPLIAQKVCVAANAMGGKDKATVDARYEQLRYYALTNDRLYTRMDVDAFLRKDIMAEFGSDEFRRIFIRINIEGTAGDRALRRGLYIDIEFKDRKNFDHATAIGYDTLLRQRIENHACIAMPIIVTLKNLEG